MSQHDRIPYLQLPRRYEALEREAKDRAADITQIVQRVDVAATRVESLLRQVRDGGIGRFELFLGRSGAGKTTFFKTLTKFFSGTEVGDIPPTTPLTEVADYVRQRNLFKNQRQVWVMFDRDNPIVDEAEAFQFFESLRILFRENTGRVVICWPITDEAKAQMLSEQAWNVGRDSIVDLNRGRYLFEGPPRIEYAKIADLTARSLHGQPLEVYGLTEDVINPLVQQSETISEFYSRLEMKSAEINGLYRDILKDRQMPSIWILVAGDNSKDLSLTVATLTQGTQKLIDIDRLISFLDDPQLDAAYRKEWKKRRSQIAFLFRLLDVRVFELPPNVALAAVRAFGDESLREALKLRTVSQSVAIDTVRKAPFFKALIGEEYGRVAYLKSTDPETSNEYYRMQASARTDDKKLNKALAKALQAALYGVGTEESAVDVKAEIKAPDSHLKPDIMIRFPQKLIYLEPTWRSMGKGIEGEIPIRQNTLTVGHIQKYLLEKVLGCVDNC